MQWQYSELWPSVVTEFSSFECIQFEMYSFFFFFCHIVSKEGTKINIMSLVFLVLIMETVSGSAEGRLCDWSGNQEF